MTPPAPGGDFVQSPQGTVQFQAPLIDWYSERQASSLYERIASREASDDPNDDKMVDVVKASERLPPESSMAMSARSHTVAASEISSHIWTDRSSEVPQLSHGAPSLDSAQLSVPSDIASNFSGFPVLDLETNEVTYPPRAGFECAFSFRGCPQIFEDIEPWKEHCLSHFHLHAPPRTISCPLCDFQRGPEAFRNGWEAWHVRLNHIALHHHMMGYSLAASRPDFALFKYLWQKHLIPDAEYQDLMNNYGQRAERSQFTTLEGGPGGRRARNV